MKIKNQNEYKATLRIADDLIESLEELKEDLSSDKPELVIQAYANITATRHFMKFRQILLGLGVMSGITLTDEKIDIDNDDISKVRKNPITAHPLYREKDEDETEDKICSKHKEMFAEMIKEIFN